MGERSGGSLAVYVGHIIGALALLIKRTGEFARRDPNWLLIVKKNYGFWWMARFDSDLRPLDDRPVRNGCVLDDDNNAVANNKAKILAVTFLHVILVDHPHVTTDARVLIDYGSLDDRVCSNPQRNLSTFQRL